MKFKNFTIDEFIEYLISCKSSNLLDYRKVTRVSGEITMHNGEDKHKKENEDYKNEI